MPPKMRPLFDPQTGRLLRPPGPPIRQPILGSPLQRRGFGDFPSGDGTPGNAVYPYNETDVFNPSSVMGGTVSVPPTGPPPPVPAPPYSAAQPVTMISMPFGESDRLWSNPNTYAAVPINAGTTAIAAILAQNYRRSLLLIQNQSTATAVGDTPPTLYIGFNAQAQVGGSLALPPGIGIVFDIICPRDAIFVAFGPFVNTGHSVVIAGTVGQCTYTPEPGS